MAENVYVYAYVCAYMGTTSIRLSTEAKTRLDLYKREGESYEDVILRLTERDPWAGFGALADAEQDTGEGMRRIREKMRRDMEDDVEDL